MLALFVDARHPGTLHLHQLAVRRRREENRSDEEGHGVRVRPNRAHVCGDSAQGEAGRADHEQPGDGRVKAAGSARMLIHGPQRTEFVFAGLDDVTVDTGAPF